LSFVATAAGFFTGATGVEAGGFGRKLLQASVVVAFFGVAVLLATGTILSATLGFEGAGVLGALKMLNTSKMAPACLVGCVEALTAGVRGALVSSAVARGVEAGLDSLGFCSELPKKEKRPSCFGFVASFDFVTSFGFTTSLEAA
jgi:hypothetical protein